MIFTLIYILSIQNRYTEVVIHCICNFTPPHPIIKTNVPYATTLQNLLIQYNFAEDIHVAGLGCTLYRRPVLHTHYGLGDSGISLQPDRDETAGAGGDGGGRGGHGAEETSAPTRQEATSQVLLRDDGEGEVSRQLFTYNLLKMSLSQYRK